MALIGILQQLIARPYNNYNTQRYHQNKWNTNSQPLDDRNLQIINNKKGMHINILLKLSNRWKCNIRYKLKHQKIQTPFYTFRIQRAVIVYSIHFNRHKKGINTNKTMPKFQMRDKNFALKESEPEIQFNGYEEWVCFQPTDIINYIT